jgi:hypothetical protein
MRFFYKFVPELVAKTVHKVLLTGMDRHVEGEERRTTQQTYAELGSTFLYSVILYWYFVHSPFIRDLPPISSDCVATWIQ